MSFRLCSEMYVNASVLDFPKKVLCKDVWDGEILKPSVRNFLLEKLYEVLKKYYKNPKNWIINVYLAGSIATYQYNDDTDIDVHFLVEWNLFLKNEKTSSENSEEIHKEIKENLVKERYKYFLPNTRHALEFYAYPTEESIPADVAYDLIENKWLAVPQKYVEDPYLRFAQYLDEAKKIAEQIDVLIGGIKRKFIENDSFLQDMKKPFSIISKIEKEIINKYYLKNVETILLDANELVDIFVQITEAREEKFKNVSDLKAQMTKENIIFKFIQKFGYFESLRKIREIFKQDLAEEEKLNKIKNIFFGENNDR
jgi:hypothetical protein